MDLSDQNFLHQFEQITLSPTEFKHHGHLRLAWLYLKKYPLKVAIEKTIKGIEAYAISLGATDKFHHTMTEAIMRILHCRLQQTPSETLEEFFRDNQDLVECFRDVLYMYYSKELLNSDLAKRKFISPDLKNFNQTIYQHETL